MTVSAPTRMLAVLCLASACWAFSFGLGAPLASLWLHDRGFSDTVLGLNTSIYYLGIAVAAMLVPRLMRRWGNGCMIAGMAASALTVALFPCAGSLLGWHTLRLLNGFAGALSLIPLETRVNHNATPEQRAQHFGFYAFAIALGIALGTLAGMQLYPFAPYLAFVLGGVAAAVAGVLVLGWLPQSHVAEEMRHSRTPLQFRRHFLSFGSAWAQGFLEGGMVSLVPIYLLSIGLSEAGVSWLMSGIMLGVILFQVPVAWLADRLGRTPVLAGCFVVAAIGLAITPFCASVGWLTVGLFSVGACSGAFYPLGLAILGERLPDRSLARANAWYLAINCVGSLTGPVLIGAAMDGFGKRALFAAGEAAVLLVFGSWIVLALTARRDKQVVAEPSMPDAVAERAAA
jgi:MFS family permease